MSTTLDVNLSDRRERFIKQYTGEVPRIEQTARELLRKAIAETSNRGDERAAAGAALVAARLHMYPTKPKLVAERGSISTAKVRRESRKIRDLVDGGVPVPGPESWLKRLFRELPVSPSERALALQFAGELQTSNFAPSTIAAASLWKAAKQSEHTSVYQTDIADVVAVSPPSIRKVSREI